MQEVKSVQATAGKGLEGDHSPIKHASLISLEATDEANVAALPRHLFEEIRRNIVTCGIDPNKLVGKEFLVGEVRMRGVEPCCDSRFAGKGGLRAEILSSGIISVDDSIHVLS